MSKPFKVDISVLGRFHGFNLAGELYKHGYLRTLISSYPAFIGKRYGVPPSHFQSLIFWEIFQRALRKIKPAYRSFWNEQFLICDSYDRSAAKKLRSGANLFVGWSGSSLHSMRVAKKLGIKTVLERGSTHIEFQTDILRMEYTKWGQIFQETHPEIIKKELQEYAEADFICVPSTYVKNTFLKKGVEKKKLIHVPYGVSLAQFFRDVKSEKSTNDTWRIICCGNLSFRKGTPYLLRAFQELRLPKAELWLVGNVQSEIQPFLEKIDSNIKIFGKVPQEKLRAFYSEADIFCLPSLEEGLAMVIPQAMACGLPVICTENTGAADIARDGVDGFIISRCDIEKLKEKILFFYENRKAAQEMGQQAMRHILGAFTWENYGSKMISEYQRILGL